MSLIEGLISIVILGITTAALLAGMLAFVTNSSRHRSQSSANLILVGATEALLDPARTAYNATCAAPAYTSADALDGVSLPTGWTSSNLTVGPVRYWNGTSFQATCYDRTDVAPICPLVDDPVVIDAFVENSFCRLQEITVAVNSPDGKATLSMTVVKRGS